jgi:ubiquinone/menaquinone biosynthesis C-methylase UbiE
MFTADDAYDRFMGRYSMRLAPLFAEFAGVREGQRVLDVGAGTGALATELVRRGAEVAAVDPSEAFVAALERRLPGIEVHAAPAEELPWPDEHFDAALAQLVVTFMSNAPAGIAEMRRVVRRGGTVAACMWDRQGMEMLAAINRAQDAVGSTAPTTEARTLYRSREEVESLFADGFDDVTTELLEVESGYTGFDEFWDALDGRIGPAGAWVASLDEEQRARAREELYRQLDEPAGAFTLKARAWSTHATTAGR